MERVSCFEIFINTESDLDLSTRFIRDLKEKCLTKPGNPHFWEKIQGVGRELSLINKQEAKKQGGDSDVTENEAVEVSCFFAILHLQALINHVCFTSSFHKFDIFGCCEI